MSFLSPPEELRVLSLELRQAVAFLDEPCHQEPLSRLDEAAKRIGRSSSGSWLGYHSLVYYEGFKLPPPGAHFSQEWGLVETYVSQCTTGDWIQHAEVEVTAAVRRLAGNPDLTELTALVKAADAEFARVKAEILSILESELVERSDDILRGVKTALVGLRCMNPYEVANEISPKGQFVTRDAIAAGQPNQTPPHFTVLAQVMSMQHTVGICRAVANESEKAAAHIERRLRRGAPDRQPEAKSMGTHVFIGHGRSSVWRDLKEFIQDRLGLQWDEFNRVSSAGMAITGRLSQMLDDAAVAFVVMTAEDEQADGQLQARMNVIHEVGLFQGRLGFSKAVVLLEDGCAEFSNIHGLGQIRFPKGDIRARFEEIRHVLEREGLIK